jgi:beta-glucosidase
MATYFQFGQDSPNFPTPGYGLPKGLTSQHVFVNAKSTSSRQILLDSAIEGHVLVKNTDGSRGLPLRKPQLVSVFGYDAVDARLNPSTAGPASRSSQIINRKIQEEM